MSRSLLHDYTEAFETLARAGAAAYRTKYGILPDLSHMVFKFGSPTTYEDYASQAVPLGAILRKQFQGREITWCKLHTPLQAGKLKLEWLEILHPGKDPHHLSGVSALTYHVPGLAETVKIDSSDPEIIFRYQAAHASELAI
jgi:predicted metalloenzyme YecM